MLRRFLSAVMVIIMVASMFSLPVNAAVMKKDTAAGKFYCTFENNSYDSHIKTLRGISADNTWGMQFPIINEIIEKKVSFETVRSVSITVKASNTSPCDKGTSPKIELHWNTRDNNEGSVTAEFENGSATVSGTLPAGTRQIVLNPYAFSASAGEITFDVTIDITYEEPTVEPESGYIGYPNTKDVRWDLSTDGTLTLSGNGGTRPFNRYDWYFGDKPIKKIVIEDGITLIGSYIFQKCDKVKSVVIAPSVTTIGMGAFDSCWELASVQMSENVTKINSYAFRYCNKLQEIALPDTLTYIGNNCFEKCIVLPCINIPGSVTEIGDSAFLECREMTDVTIGDGVTSIGNKVFGYCDKLQNVSLPVTITDIGNSAFAGCKELRLSTIPANVTSIGDYAFNLCNSITEFLIPESVKTIGERAFQSCENLKKLIIPSANTSFGRGVTLFSDKATIYGRSGSFSQEWANANDVPFVLIAPLPGDVSGEGSIDFYDLEMVLKHITGVCLLQGDSFTRADMDSNGSVDIRDYNLLFAKIM